MSKELSKNFEVNTSDEFSDDYDDFLQEHANTSDFCGDLFSNSKPGEQWVRCRCKSCKFCNKHDVPAAQIALDGPMLVPLAAERIGTAKTA